MQTITPTSLPEEDWQYADKFNPHSFNDYLILNVTNYNDLNMTIALHNEQPEPILHNYTYWCNTVTVKVFSFSFFWW